MNPIGLAFDTGFGALSMVGNVVWQGGCVAINIGYGLYEIGSQLWQSFIDVCGWISEGVRSLTERINRVGQEAIDKIREFIDVVVAYPKPIVKSVIEGALDGATKGMASAAALLVLPGMGEVFISPGILMAFAAAGLAIGGLRAVIMQGLKNVQASRQQSEIFLSGTVWKLQNPFNQSEELRFTIADGGIIQGPCDELHGRWEPRANHKAAIFIQNKRYRATMSNKGHSLRVECEETGEVYASDYVGYAT